MKLDRNRRSGLLARCGLLALALLPLQALAGDALELSIVVGNRASYVTPDGSKILITRQPTVFSIRVRNTSQNAQKIYTDRVSGALSSLSFELTDDKGVRKVITQKREEDSGQGKVWASRYLGPGEEVVSDIEVTPETWNNAEVVQAGEVRRFKVRAVYQSEATTLRSEEYELTIAPGGMPEVMNAPAAAAPAGPPPITVIK